MSPPRRRCSRRSARPTTQVAAGLAIASDVVQATLSASGEFTWALDWAGHGRTLDGSAGALSGSDPIELAQRLASELRRRLAPEFEAAVLDHDPYLLAVRTHARYAMDGERWESARRLLQVAVDEAPDDTMLQLDLARCLVHVRDAGAQPLLERLQHAATASADTVLERRCLQLQARRRHGEGDELEAEQLLSRALLLAESEHDREAELQLLLSMAELHAERGRGAIADWLLDRAAALAQALGDRAAIARTLDTRGRLAATDGDRDAAIRHFDDALQIQRVAGIHAGAAHTLTHLGDMHHAFGRISIARQYFAAAFDKALASGDPSAIAIAGLNVGRYAGISIGRDDFAIGVVERMRAHESPGRIVIDTFADLLDAFVQARAGRLGDGLELLDRAEAGYARRNFRLRVRRFRTLVLAASGFIDEAQRHDARIPRRRAERAALADRVARQHLAGICAHAAGDLAAALRHVDAATRSAPHSLWRLEMIVRRRVARARGGDRVAAARVLDRCRAEFDAALADDHAPALVLRAMQHEVAGERDAAAACARVACCRRCRLSLERHAAGGALSCRAWCRSPRASGASGRRGAAPHDALTAGGRSPASRRGPRPAAPRAVARWRPQPLAPRAFDVLVALIEQRHRVVSKDDLIAHCWNGEAGNDGALARVVMNVRRSIGDIGDAARDHRHRARRRLSLRCGSRAVGRDRRRAAAATEASGGAPRPPRVAAVRQRHRRCRRSRGSSWAWRRCSASRSNRCRASPSSAVPRDPRSR